MNQLLSSSINTDLWLGRAVPRYTSYPSAPTFHNGISEEDYTINLASIPENKPVSLYVHIPFCKELCLYCGCHTSITRNHKRLSSYRESVKNESRLLAARIGRRQKVGKLHFGGGTPNILLNSDITDLFSVLHDCFDFSSCREIAIELDPRSIDKKQIKTLAACGINRVSLGVQDFNSEVQKAVNRLQPFDMIKRVCDDLRRSGIKQINFDLIYGLPLQNLETISRTAEQTCDLFPERIALYSYAHVPQLKKHQKALEAYGLADKQKLLEIESAARKVFVNAGYEEIGMDHFAKPDDNLAEALRDKKLRRNFQGYTDDAAKALLGIGASSIGIIKNNYYQNEREISLYQDKISSGQLAVVRGINSSGEDILRSEIIEELMCYMQCDIKALCEKHGIPETVFSDEFEKLKSFKDAGIIEQNDFKIKLAIEHRMAIRVICSVFDRYLMGKKAVASRVA